MAKSCFGLLPLLSNLRHTYCGVSPVNSVDWLLPKGQNRDEMHARVDLGEIPDKKGSSHWSKGPVGAYVKSSTSPPGQTVCTGLQSGSDSAGEPPPLPLSRAPTPTPWAICIRKSKCTRVNGCDLKSYLVWPDLT